MIRLALLFTLVFVLWRALENTLGDWLRKSLPSRDAGFQSHQEQSESLVRCEICGVHVPRSRAVPGPKADSPIYCSDVCRKAGVSGVC